MKLLVVIVCYRVPDLVIDCLRSLDVEIRRVPDSSVAVVENGTGGDSADKIRDAIARNGWDAWSRLTVIHPNLGFTGGNNVAITEALASDDPPEYLLLLNSDTIVLENALPPLVDFMDRHPKAGVAGSLSLAPKEGDTRLSCARFPGVIAELDRGLRLGLISRLFSRWTSKVPPAKAAPVDWVSGAAMILRRTMLEQIGLLDEGLYTYFDDVDICIRARRAGWETWHVPESRIIHIAGASTGVTARKAPKRVPDYWFEARRRCYLKNFGRLRTALADAAFLTGYSLYRLRLRVQRKPDTDAPHYLADFFRHSVFRTGFQIRTVKNPALTEPTEANPVAT